MRRLFVFATVTMLMVLAGCNKSATQGSSAGGTALNTDEEKTVYALGLAIGRQLKDFNLSDSELAIVKQALSDQAAGKPAVELETWGPKIGDLQRSRVGKVAEVQKQKGKEFADKAAAESGAVKTSTGLVYKDLKVGTGKSPMATSTVKVHYKGTLIDGTEFDSSYKRNMPAEFPLNGVIPCWTEGVQKMKVGGKAQLVCPSDIAYGDQGNPSIPGGATLVFEVELLDVLS
jgi:FKBP-type peptidyl-prolyl cis-trans isomerase FkpA